MKANIFHIISAHIDTLCDDNTSKILFVDMFIFYALPAYIADVAIFFDLKLDDNVFSLAVSVFSIFAALLLSVQIALFSIFQKENNYSRDAKMASIQMNKIDLRNSLIKELNTNISYLMILCCIFVVILMAFYSLKINYNIEVYVFIYMIIHFSLTIFMVIKRAHALFHVEYERSNVN